MTRRERGAAFWPAFMAVLLGVALTLVRIDSVSAQAGSDPVATQETMALAQMALDSCLEALAASDGRTAVTAATRAERLFEEAAAVPEMRPQALRGWARVLTGCRIPQVDDMDKLAYLDGATSMLREALQLAPDYWPARFSLAMTLFSAPAFLGHTNEAIRQLQALIEEDGEGVEQVLPEVYRSLGDALRRTGRADEAMERWREGLTRFPDDEALRSRVSGRGGGNASPDPPGAVQVPVYELEPISVEAGSFALGDPSAGIPVTRVEVYAMPGGAADVLQTFQTMPGVTRLGEGSDLYVRGGDASETAVFVDDVRVHEAGTFERLDGSLFSILDPSVLRRAYFSSGGFSVRYGDALSSVVDAETEGRPNTEGWRAGANVVSIGGTVRRHLGDRAGAWAAASATDVRALLALQGRGGEYPSSPRAAQVTAGFTFNPDGETELRATALHVADRSDKIVRALGYEGAFRGSNGTTLASARYRRIGSSGMVTVAAGGTRRSTGFRLGVLDRSRSDDGAELSVAAQLGTGREWLRFGAEGRALRTTERGTVPTAESLAPGAPSRALTGSVVSRSHVGGYAEGALRLGPQLALVTGARVDRLPGESSWTADPRVSVAYGSGDWTFRAGAGVFHQGRMRVRYQEPDAGSPSGTPRRARHWTVGIEHEGPWRARLELYRKHYDRYVADQGRGPPTVEGVAEGADLLVRRSGDGAEGWVSYSYLRGRAILRDGRRVPSNTDVTHSVTAVASKSFGDRWEFGLTGRLASGRPFTAVTGSVPANAEAGSFAEPEYDAPNGARMPAYLRADGRVTHYRPLGAGVLAVYLEAINLLARRNVASYQYDGDYAHRYAVEAFFGRRTLILGVEARF